MINSRLEYCRSIVLSFKNGTLATRLSIGLSGIYTIHSKLSLFEPFFYKHYMRRVCVFVFCMTNALRQSANSSSSIYMHTARIYFINAQNDARINGGFIVDKTRVLANSRYNNNTIYESLSSGLRKINSRHRQRATLKWPRWTGVGEVVRFAGDNAVTRVFF